eukprot:2077483-Pyramimonas_sp.AAC.1
MDANNVESEFYISGDKNPATIKRELGLKVVRRELAVLAPQLKFFSDKESGEISSGWEPLIKL